MTLKDLWKINRRRHSSPSGQCLQHWGISRIFFRIFLYHLPYLSHLMLLYLLPYLFIPSSFIIFRIFSSHPPISSSVSFSSHTPLSSSLSFHPILLYHLSYLSHLMLLYLLPYLFIPSSFIFCRIFLSHLLYNFPYLLIIVRFYFSSSLFMIILFTVWILYINFVLFMVNV